MASQAIARYRVYLRQRPVILAVFTVLAIVLFLALLPIAPLPSLHPDHPLETALQYVERWPLVPVVSRADFRKLEGVVTQRHVLERYREFGEG